MNAWVAVIGAGAGSFLFRFAMVAAIDRYRLPHWFERGSVYVMPAAFAGLAASSLRATVSEPVATAAPVWLAVVAAVVVARRRPAQVAVAAGMATLWGSHLVLAVL